MTVKPTDALTRETVSIIAAAKLTGVSRRTIYNWLADEKVQAVRTAGGIIRIFVDTLFVPLGPLPKKTRTTRELNLKLGERRDA